MTTRERPVIGFLTDFGLDSAAATCRAVILSICRDAQIVDICHTVRKYQIRDGARLMSATLPYLPVGVHLGVVDPGVGTTRHGIALRAARGDILVGPDNGLLVPPAEKLGGVAAVRVLENKDFWLPVTSSTFHGRDVFAAVVGNLVAGHATFEALGPELATDELIRLTPPTAHVADGVLTTQVTYVDSFGNLRLAGTPEQLEAAVGSLDAGRPLTVEFIANGAPDVRDEARFARTFGEVPAGAPLLYVDSSGGLAYADSQGNVAARLGIEADRSARISAR